MKFKIKLKPSLITEQAKPPFWKWEDGLTQSFINSWLQCTETTRLRYLEGWKPRKKSPWFEFGTVFHYCIEQAFNYFVPKNLPYHPEVSQLQIKQWIAKYEREEKNPLEQITSDEIEQAELIYLLAEKLLPIYFRLHQADFNNEVIYNETKFDLTENGDRFRGKIDLGWKEKSNGSFWLLDTKCLSVIQPEVISGTMQHDIQCMLYLWAAATLKQNPKGIIYNVIRRPAHYRRKDESIDEFTSRIAVEAQSKPDHFFMRFRLEITPEEVQTWYENELSKITDDICAWSSNPKKRSYINPNALVTKYGKSQYFDLLTKQDYSNYYQDTNPFSELAK